MYCPVLYCTACLGGDDGEGKGKVKGKARLRKAEVPCGIVKHAGHTCLCVPRYIHSLPLLFHSPIVMAASKKRYTICNCNSHTTAWKFPESPCRIKFLREWAAKNNSLAGGIHKWSAVPTWNPIDLSVIHYRPRLATFLT
jgi:hypothetical protein